MQTFKLFTGLTGAVLLATNALSANGASAQEPVEISISCGAVGVELELCQEGADAWAEKTGNTVSLVSTPNSTTERLALYQQLLSAGAKDIDVFQIDIIWPGILGSHFIDLAPYSGGVEDKHFEAIVSTNTIDGELKAMPWFTDAGVLYYRKDLLEQYGHDVPETWAQLTDIARDIKEQERAAGNDGFWGFVFQGRAYEGLTTNALEWLDAYGAGTIVDADGEVTVNNPQAVEALTMVSGWVGDIAPEGVLNYAEEEARGVFQSGNAAFMRNWPYAWSLGNSEDSPIKGKIGVAALPKGGENGQHTGTLGGWNLAVSRYSEHPEEAADLAMYLSSQAEQRRRAIKGAYNPTINALYSDDEVLAANPFFGELHSTFVNAVARPSEVVGRSYNRVSNAFWNATHSVLSGAVGADEALEGLEGSLNRIKRGGW